MLQTKIELKEEIKIETEKYNNLNDFLNSEKINELNPEEVQLLEMLYKSLSEYLAIQHARLKLQKGE